jgi:hypothetical protein
MAMSNSTKKEIPSAIPVFLNKMIALVPITLELIKLGCFLKFKAWVEPIQGIPKIVSV